MTAKSVETLEPKLEEIAKDEKSNRPSIGLPANYADNEETRFPLTPEACGMLTSSGYRVLIEEGAGIDISFSDEAYTEYGGEIVSRTQALKADTVLSFAPINDKDVLSMTKGATLLCMMGDELFKTATIRALLDREITLGCLDNMYSMNDDPVFANIINEIDGRAAILYAQEHLSFLGGGKGVLLAGVAGINPCEVLVIGEGTDVFAAASAAIATGASVTLMNNDISALFAARQWCGPQLTTLAIHPRVLSNKCRTADVIIIGDTTRPFELPSKLKRVMKENAFLLNLKEAHPSVTVPRTVAMAISNVLINFFAEMMVKSGFESMLASTEGVQAGIICYRGKLCDKLIAGFLGLPSVDIKMMLAAKN